MRNLTEAIRSFQMLGVMVVAIAAGQTGVPQRTLANGQPIIVADALARRDMEFAQKQRLVAISIVNAARKDIAARNVASAQSKFSKAESIFRSGRADAEADGMLAEAA